MLHLKHLRYVLLAGTLLLVGGLFTAAAASPRMRFTFAAQADSKPTDSAIAQAIAEGHQAYAMRSAAVQDVIRHMYDNEGSYRAFSALVVDRAPGDQPSSLRVAIQQPDVVKAALFNDLAGSGSPVDIATASAGVVTEWDPAGHVYAQSGTLDQRQSLPDVANAPLGTVQDSSGGTPIRLSFGTVDVLANMMIHPTALVTSPFFTSKMISVGEGRYANRSVWVLHGRQVSQASPLGGLGDGWTMSVDKETGIVLRIEYFNGNAQIGDVSMTEVTIDGVGVANAGAPTIRPLPSTYAATNPHDFSVEINGH
jgi:hypothetical protein